MKAEENPMDTPPTGNPVVTESGTTVETASTTATATQNFNADALISAGTQGLVALTGLANGFMQNLTQNSENTYSNGSLNDSLPGAPVQRLSNREAIVARLKEEGAKIVARPILEHYSKPITRMEWLSRIRSNFGQFYLTYTIVYFVTVLWVLLTSPLFLFEVALVAALWIYAFLIRNPDQVVVVGSYQLGRREKYLVLIPITALVAVFGGLLGYVTYSLIIGSIFTVGHASFRNKIVMDPLEQMQNEAEQTPFV